MPTIQTLTPLSYRPFVYLRRISPAVAWVSQLTVPSRSSGRIPSRKSPSALIEIRLRLADQVENVDLTILGYWHPNTPDHRERLAIAAEMGNRIFGPDTHWIEERQAFSQGMPICASGVAHEVGDIEMLSARCNAVPRGVTSYFSRSASWNHLCRTF